MKQKLKKLIILIIIIMLPGCLKETQSIEGDCIKTNPGQQRYCLCLAYTTHDMGELFKEGFETENCIEYWVDYNYFCKRFNCPNINFGVELK